MSIENLKALTSGLRTEHGGATIGPDCLHCVVADAKREIEAIENAAKALVANHVGDVMVDRVAHSEEVVSTMTDSRSQWFHPRVTEVGEACEVLKVIAKGASNAG